MLENCLYYKELKCPYAGMYFCVSPCFNCSIGILPSLDYNTDSSVEKIK